MQVSISIIVVVLSWWEYIHDIVAAKPLAYVRQQTQVDDDCQEDGEDTPAVQVRAIHADLVMPEDNSNQSDEVNELSQNQCKRLQHQAQTILLWLEKRCSQLTRMVEYFAINNGYAMRDFYTAHPLLTIDNLVREVCQRARVCVKTFRKWRKQFILLGGFDRDERGLSQFGWLLVNDDKKVELTYWLKSQKQLSCGDTRDWINNVLLKEFPIGRIPEWGRLKRPIVPSTAHRLLMRNCADVSAHTSTHIMNMNHTHTPPITTTVLIIATHSPWTTRTDGC